MNDFRLGLQRYLKQHSYGNAVHGDLWDALTSVAVEKGLHANIFFSYDWLSLIGGQVIKT